MNRPSVCYGYGRHSTNKQELTREASKTRPAAPRQTSLLLRVSMLLTAADPSIGQHRNASGETT